MHLLVQYFVGPGFDAGTSTKICRVVENVHIGRIERLLMSRNSRGPGEMNLSPGGPLAQLVRAADS